MEKQKTIAKKKKVIFESTTYHMYLLLILCKNKGILGRDIVCQRDCYFQIKLQFPAGAKNFMNSQFTSNSFILSWSPNFHKLIVSLKICENSEFSVSNLLDNMMISPYSSDSFTNLETMNIHLFRETEFHYLFFCTMNNNIQFCRFVVSK